MFGYKPSFREKILSAAAALAAAVSLVYAVVFEPAARRWASLDRQIESETNTLRKDLRILPALPALRSKYDALLKNTPSPASGQGKVAAILGEIESVAGRAAVEISNIKPQPAKISGGYGEILMEVTAEGGIGEIARFVYGLEHDPNMLVVRRLVISARSGDERSLQCQLLISKTFIARA